MDNVKLVFYGPVERMIRLRRPTAVRRASVDFLDIARFKTLLSSVFKVTVCSLHTGYLSYVKIYV